MRAFAIFAGAAAAAFTLMFAAIVWVLPTAFETQGIGWLAAPFRTVVVTVGNVLLFPLGCIYATVGNTSGFGFAAVAVLSIVYGAAAVGLWAIGRRGNKV